jgi:hypothetical protein
MGDESQVQHGITLRKTFVYTKLNLSKLHVMKQGV